MNTQQEIFVRRSYRANEMKIARTRRNARKSFGEFSLTKYTPQPLILQGKSKNRKIILTNQQK